MPSFAVECSNIATCSKDNRFGHPDDTNLASGLQLSEIRRPR
jgi:hypothetical protein